MIKTRISGENEGQSEAVGWRRACRVWLLLYVIGSIALT